MKKTFCVSSNFRSDDEDDELESRDEYLSKSRNMIISDAKDLAAKINSQSLEREDKNQLIKDSVLILLNSIN